MIRQHTKVQTHPDHQQSNNFFATPKTVLRSFMLVLAILVSTLSLTAQKIGYQIKVQIDGFEEKEAYLGYFFGDKQYLRDTAYAEADGRFYFEGNEKLESGVYLIVLPPDNKFFQILVSEDEQWFSIQTKMPDFENNIKIEGSPDNQLFYQYLGFLSEKRPEAVDIRAKLDEAEKEGDEKKKAKLEEKLEEIDDEVKAYQKNLIAQHPQTLTAAIIRANQPMEDMPEFTGDEKEIQYQQFYWTRKHWFDNIDLGDPRMLRTPFLFQKIDQYVEKMTVKHPDSIAIAIDKVLEMTRPAEETFKFYLIHFLNSYAKSKLVGMDAVYVHIAKKYYKTGQAPWTDEEQLNKIIENAEKLEPLLIGKVAPNIELQYQDGSPIQLHDFKSPYTVLFFWDPDCGHCKKSMPEMVQFAKDYKDKGVAVFAICTELVTRDETGNFSMEEVKKCWTTIEEREMDVFWNAVDPYHRSRYKTIYDIRSTPQVYVLDKDKKILSKRIGADQLPSVMEQIIKMDQENSNGGIEK